MIPCNCSHADEYHDSAGCIISGCICPTRREGKSTTALERALWADAIKSRALNSEWPHRVSVVDEFVGRLLVERDALADEVDRVRSEIRAAAKAHAAEAIAGEDGE